MYKHEFTMKTSQGIGGVMEMITQLPKTHWIVNSKWMRFIVKYTSRKLIFKLHIEGDNSSLEGN